MKKVLILFIILIILTSTTVFATGGWYLDYTPTLPSFNSEYPYQTITFQGGSPFWYASTTPIYGTGSFNTASGQFAVMKYVNNEWINYVTQSTTVPYLRTTFSSAYVLAASNHDIYSDNTFTSVFFKALHPLEAGMMGALPNLLQSLLIILPIILGGILLAIGFRKAWTMLIRTFKTT